MGIKIDRDCVPLPDGSMVCWDKSTGETWILGKKAVKMEDLPKDVLLALMKTTKTPEPVCSISQEDLDIMFNHNFEKRPEINCSKPVL